MSGFGDQASKFVYHHVSGIGVYETASGIGLRQVRRRRAVGSGSDTPE